MSSVQVARWTYAATLRNTIALVLSKGLLAGVRIVFLLWVARISTPEEFGRLVLCFSLVEILRVVVDFGTEILFVRRLARSREEAEEQRHLAQLAVFRVVACAAGVTLFFVVTALFSAERFGAAELMSVSLLVTALAIGYTFTFYQARLIVERATRILAVTAVCYAVAAILAHDLAIEAQLGVLIAFELLASVWLLLDLRKMTGLNVSHIVDAATGSTIRMVAKDSLPLAGSAILVVIYTRLDVFAVKQLVGSVALGLYGFAFRLTEPFRFLSGAVDSTFYSYLARRIGHAQSSEELRVSRLVIFVIFYALLLAVSAAATGYGVTQTIFSNYAPAMPVILVLSVALGLRCLAGFMAAFQNALGNFHLIFRFASVSFVLILILVYPLTTRLGLVGTALSLLIAELINVLVQAFFFFKAARELKAGVCDGGFDGSNGRAR